MHWQVFKNITSGIIIDLSIHFNTLLSPKLVSQSLTLSSGLLCNIFEGQVDLTHVLSPQNVTNVNLSVHILFIVWSRLITNHFEYSIKRNVEERSMKSRVHDSPSCMFLKGLSILYKNLLIICLNVCHNAFLYHKCFQLWKIIRHTLYLKIKYFINNFRIFYGKMTNEICCNLRAYVLKRYS